MKAWSAFLYEQQETSEKDLPTKKISYQHLYDYR